MSSPWVIHPRTFSLLIPEAARQHAAGWLTGAILLGMSRYDAVPERESNRTVVVVLLSLLILTVIGALLGYVLGQRDIDKNKSAVGDGQSARPPSAGATPGPQCPDFIGKAVTARDKNAALPLYLVIYIRTKGNREVWICREADQNGLWYQGHERRKGFYDEGEIPVEGDNGLLLDGVVATAGSYAASNGGTTYRVTRQSLAVNGDQNYIDPTTQSRVPG